VYKAFYGLQEDPFNITPDPRFLYWSQKHQEAFRHLVYGVQSNKGLVVLTGEPGTGKTAILHAVTEQLRTIYPGVHIAFLVNSKITVQDLFCLIFDEFHIDNTAESKSGYLIHFKKFLMQNHLKNEKSVLILDEAQNFHPTILEEIRLLSNMETAAEKLLHIFLVGQPKLLATINIPALDQLKQRLGIIYNLLPLNRLETERYIHKRLSVAGAPKVELFTTDALDEIFAYARGLPRLINVICDNALLFGSAAKTEQVDRDIIKRVAQDMALYTLTESVATDRDLPAPPSSLAARPQVPTSSVVPAAPLRTGLQAPQPAVSEDADHRMLQNTAFAEGEYWDNLLRQSLRSDKKRRRTWREAAERELLPGGKRLFIVVVVLLALVGGLVGEHLGLWSLRAVTGRTVETVTQQVALLYPTAVAPGAGGMREEERQDVPPGRPVLPGVTQGQHVGREKGRVVKKEVVVRPGDTLSKILAQTYGEYTKAVVDMVTEANPGLGNIHFLEVGQRLILPERPE
jgi:general secretion pathway protein A